MSEVAQFKEYPLAEVTPLDTIDDLEMMLVRFSNVEGGAFLVRVSRERFEDIHSLYVDGKVPASAVRAMQAKEPGGYMMILPARFMGLAGSKSAGTWYVLNVVISDARLYLAEHKRYFKKK